MFFPKHVVILCFEGPDPYSQVGGLGVRVTELAEALTQSGVSTELIFIGDPSLPQASITTGGVHLRRALQDLSKDYPDGVYDGEYNKIDAFARDVPQIVIDEHIAPAASRGEQVLVLVEEWQTVKATIELDRKLRERHLRSSAVILWNANNTYGFDSVDWVALQGAATITTISKFMKFEMRARGVNALVIPNGIPIRLLDGPPADQVKRFREAISGDPFLVKVGRFDPDKRWFQAIDAIHELRKRGSKPRLVIRGGSESHGREVLLRAKSVGLQVDEFALSVQEPNFFSDLAKTRGDVVVLTAPLPQPVLFALYAAADAVLANSGKEPFGLVGLEVMAAGGLPVCGATGEEYAEPFVNAIVCDTDDGLELATYIESTLADPREVHLMHAAAQATAKRYTWPTVLNVLARKLEFIAARTAEANGQ
ncbi:MAG: glycosyltransferase [Candidatus Eremiobacteraeota bacterium]|nr:glycosyltransferase [Candidatus Eremiobacteraeota bacterium]